MGCTSCGNRFAPTNPCSDCNKTIDNCDDAIQVAWVPNTACTFGVTFRGVTSTLALLEGIKNCETDTRMYIDPQTGCIHYNSERFVNGFPGAVDQVICPDEIVKHANLCDLADVDDTACSPDNCSFLIYKKNTDCKEGCKGVNDKWQPWTPSKNKVDKVTNVIGVNDAGCPVVGPLDFAGYFNETECTYFDPAPGFKISEPGGNSLCYYKNREQMNVVLDMNVTAARPEADYQNVHIATIHDPRFWPKINSGDFIDLPIHGSWDRPGAFSPVWLRFDENGRLLLSGHVTARTVSGLTSIIVNGVDDVISWMWKG